MAIDSKISVVKAFDMFPNTLFFGLIKQSLTGPSYTLRVLLPDKQIEVDSAHASIITDIELAKIGDVVYFFTSSADCTIKTWKIKPDGNGLELYTTKPLPTKVYQLSLAQPKFLVGACEDGTFQGWDLDSDVI